MQQTSPAVSFGLNLGNVSTLEPVPVACDIPRADWLWQKGVILIGLEHVRPTPVAETVGTLAVLGKGHAQ